MLKEFSSHRLNQDGIKKMEMARQVLDSALTVLIDLCPANREFSIVRTKMEEAGFFAVKSICVDEKNQGTETGYKELSK